MSHHTTASSGSLHLASPANSCEISSQGFQQHRDTTNQESYRSSSSDACWTSPPQNGSSCSFTNAPCPQIREAHSSPVRDTVRIRKALPSDYEAVSHLADLLGGMDFLFALYQSFVADEDTYTIVATLDDKVVGYYMTSPLDEGRTMMRRGARVHEQYRGRGVYRAMEAEIERYIREHCPNAEHVGMCKYDRDYYLVGRFEAQGFKPVYRRRTIQMIVKPSSSAQTGQACSITDHAIEAREITSQELTHLFRTEDVKKELFPEGRLYNFFLDYRPLEENVRHLICDRGGAFVSFQDSLGSQRESILSAEQHKITSHADVPITFDESRLVDNVAMVTFYYYYPTLTMPCYFLDAYTRPGVPSDHFRAHLQKHLKLLRKNFPEQDTVLAVSYEPTVSPDDVMTSLREVGVVDKKPEQYTCQVLYERRQGRDQDLIKTNVGVTLK